MRVFLTISPVGCKSTDEETGTSPASKSKPPSSLRCRRPTPAQHHPGSAPGPALAQHQAPPRACPGGGAPGQARQDPASPAQPSCQGLPGIEGWAAEGRLRGVGFMGSCKPRASRASSASALACKRANENHGSPCHSQGSHVAARWWPRPRPPRGQACVSQLVPAAARQ